MNKLNDYQHSFLSALIARKLPFLVVGGWAVYLHGVPGRSTVDLDIWISPSRLDPGDVTEALIGWGVPREKALTFCERLQNASDHRPKAKMDAPFFIDIIVDELTGTDFDLALSRRSTFVVQGLSIPVMGLDDLLAVKRTTHGEKHRGDAKALRLIQSAAKTTGP